MAEKYYLNGIEKNDINAMHNLGHYYADIKNEKNTNYDLAKKYWQMAIENNCVDTMRDLGYYYNNIENNDDLMEKYYLMFLQNNCKNTKALFVNSNRNLGTLIIYHLLQ